VVKSKKFLERGGKRLLGRKEKTRNGPPRRVRNGRKGKHLGPEKNVCGELRLDGKDEWPGKKPPKGHASRKKKEGQ